MSTSKPSPGGPRVIALVEGLDVEYSVVHQALEVVIAEHRERLADAGIGVFLHRTAAEAVLHLFERRVGRIDAQTAAALRTAYAQTEHAYVAALQAIILAAQRRERREGAADLALAVWHEVGHALMADAIVARGDELARLVHLSPPWLQPLLAPYGEQRRVQELMAWLYAVGTSYRWQLPAWIHPTLQETLNELLR